MSSVEVVKIVVVGPGDVREETEQIRAVLENLNQGMAADRALRLEFLNWRKDAYPGVHPLGPQGLIDEVLKIPDARLVIAIFWKRFGTAIPGGETGTQHEVRAAYDSWRRTKRPELMVYFNRDRVDLETREERRQYDAVSEFRESLPSQLPEIFTGEYRGSSTFAEEIRRRLENWLKANWPLGPDSLIKEPRRSIYVAATPPSLQAERQALVRELHARGWTVVPPEGLLHGDEPGIRDVIEGCLRRSVISVHLAGRRHSPLAELEADLAERAVARRILWVQPGAADDPETDASQRNFLASFSSDANLRGFRRWSERFETLLEELAMELSRPEARSAGTANVYLVYGPEDATEATDLLRGLYGLQLEVVEPPEPDEHFWEIHRDSLERCRGALFFWGRSGAAWFKRVYRAVSLEQSSQDRVRWVLLTQPRENKQPVMTYRAEVVEAYGGVTGDLLKRFAERVSAGVGL